MNFNRDATSVGLSSTNEARRDIRSYISLVDKTKSKMSKKSSLAPNPKGFDSPENTPVYNAARRIAHHPENGGPIPEDWAETLADFVDECLEGTRDFTADFACAAKDPKTADLLESCFDAQACTQPDKAGHCVYYLGALPVLIRTNSPDSLGRRIELPTVLVSEIERSYAYFGILPGESSIRLVNYLYHPEELAKLSYPEVKKLTPQVVAELFSTAPCKSGAEAGLAQSRGTDGAAAFGENKALELRYLLFCVKASDSEDIPFQHQSTPDGTERLRYSSRLTAWRNRVDTLVAAGLAANEIQEASVSVAVPKLFHGALREGLILHVKDSFAYQVSHLISTNQLSLKTSAVRVVPLVADDLSRAEVWVSFYSLLTGELTGRLIRVVYVFEKVNEVSAELTHLMAQLGATELRSVAEVQFMGKFFPKIRSLEEQAKSAALTISGRTVH